MSQQLVLATGNPHKCDELRRVLDPLIPGIELIPYDGPQAIENGVSFEENALIKARTAAAHTGVAAIADDSGIVVDVLGGCPGIFSARWAGPQRSDEANLALLLWQLSDIADEHRTAAFVCAAALAIPEAEEVCELGVWNGSVLREPRGKRGFGYDPVFAPGGDKRAVAEMTAAEKEQQSHRTRAFTLLAPHIRSHLSVRRL